MKVFTEEESIKYDGSNGITYVAVKGKVYDVSRSYHWIRGIHQVTHLAGCDLIEALKRAPHSENMLDKFPIVGEIPDPE
jgi:predicted heme/steroid binding protein